MSQIITIGIIIILCFLCVRGIYRGYKMYRAGELTEVTGLVYIDIILGLAFVFVLLRSIPDGNIVTSPVVIKDYDTKEEYVTNLLIEIDEDEDGRYYSVLGIIDTVNGKIIQTTDMYDPNYTTFEKNTIFELNDNTGRKYSCVVKYTNLPIRIISRFKYHPILLTLLGTLFIVCVVYTVFANKYMLNKANPQGQDK